MMRMVLGALLAANALVVILPIIGTVLGGLVAGGAVAAYLAKPNRRKLEAEAVSITEQATNSAVQTVTLALDRQDKTIAQQDKTIAELNAERATAREEINDLTERLGVLERSLAGGAIAEHLSAGRELILRAEIVRLGGDATDAALGIEITNVAATPVEPEKGKDR